MAVFFWLRSAAPLLLAAVPVARGQRIIASLSDPCDCQQNHDYWQTMIDEMYYYLKRDLHKYLFDPDTIEHKFFARQSCIWSHDNEDSHKLSALSDCIPGFMMMKIACVQGVLIE